MPRVAIVERVGRAFALALVLVLCAGRTASAHLALRRSEPAANARLSLAPRALRLTFSENVELAVSQLTLIGPDARPVALSSLRHAADSARTMVADIRAALATGTYTVRWLAIGDDGHPVRGTFTFSVEPGATGIAPPSSTPPARGDSLARPTPAPTTALGVGAFGVQSPLSIALRWGLFVAIVALVGAVAYRLVVLPSAARTFGDDITRATLEVSARSFGLAAAAVLLVLELARLAAEAVAMHGARGALDAGFVVTMLAATVWGRAWSAQLAAVLLTLAGLAALRRQTRAGGVLAALGVLGLALSEPFMGHAVAVPRLVPLAVVADGAHVLAAGGWLGSLLVLIAVAIPAVPAGARDARGAVVRSLVNAFSPLALGCGAILAATGAYAAWLHVGSLDALATSAYGRVLLAKLAALVLLAGLGAYNWRRVRPALGDDDSVARLGRSARMELAIGALVLAITAALVAVRPATEERTTTRAASFTARRSAPATTPPGDSGRASRAPSSTS